MSKIIDKIVFEIGLDKKPYEMFLEILMEYFFKIEIKDEKEFELLKKDKIDFHIKEIENKYGIILQNFSLKIWLEREFTLKENRLILNKYSSYTIQDIEKELNNKKYKEKEILNKIAKIRKDFLEYSSNKYGVTLKEEEAKDIFLKYDYDNYIPYNDISDDIEIAEYQNKRNLLFHNFIRELLKKGNDEDKKLIDDLGIANQFSKIIFSEDIFNQNFFSDTTFYIDTPIILKYLGYAGLDTQKTYINLLNSIKECNGKIGILAHIVDEMKSIIFTLKMKIKQGFFNAPNVNDFLKAIKENNQLALDDDDIVKSIISNGIFIDEIVYTSDNDKNYNDILIDEPSLKNYMISEYKTSKNRDKDSDYRLDVRVNVDVKSTSLISINRIRNNKNCFLLTQNNAFKRAVLKYHNYEKLLENHNEIITDNDIIFNLWQNIGNNFHNNLRTFFRLKCFSYLKIDDKFKEDFYLKSKITYEKLNKSKAKYVSSIIIKNPDLLDTAYEMKTLGTNVTTYNIFEKLIDAKIDEIKQEGYNEASKFFEEKSRSTVENIINEYQQTHKLLIEKTVEKYENKIIDIGKDHEINISKMEEINNNKQKLIFIKGIYKTDFFIKILNFILIKFPFFKYKISNYIISCINNKVNKVFNK